MDQRITECCAFEHCEAHTFSHILVQDRIDVYCSQKQTTDCCCKFSVLSIFVVVFVICSFCLCYFILVWATKRLNNNLRWLLLFGCLCQSAN